jgi:putative ATP-dependent endonuclease of the OLD family
MHLAKIAIKGFRNLKDFSIMLRPGLNVLLGENNIGKTNLLDAICLALTTTYGAERFRLSPSDLSRPGATTTIEISLWFEQLSDEEQAEFIDLLNYNPPNITASLHYTATYNAELDRWTTNRWGGDRPNTDGGIPEDVIQSLPVTMLGALRDAASALQPGRFSRLARLLKLLANDQDKTALEQIIQTANSALEGNPFISEVQGRIHTQSHQAIGSTLSQRSIIRTSEPDFERIAQNLRLVIDNNPNRTAGAAITNDELSELRNNGLGYNNLLFLATVMTELHVARNATMPLLLVEEPEAHLHPQLQTRLTDGLQQRQETKKVQTIVTSHSPTIAAHVAIADLTIIHATHNGTKATSLAVVPMTDPERAQLRRLIDVTKATLFFARGLIIVEGITEALLIPILARRLGTPLEDRAVSVIPLCGVEFNTIARLFGPERIAIPTSLVTDADPTIVTGATWRDTTFTAGTQAARVTSLETDCTGNPTICIKKASVTFEYDLALAGEHNPDLIARAWEKVFAGQPQNLNQAAITLLDDTPARALHIWRAICIADDGRRKASFAQELATLLDQKNADGTYTITPERFTVPQYLREAITHALG